MDRNVFSFFLYKYHNKQLLHVTNIFFIFFSYLVQLRDGHFEIDGRTTSDWVHVVLNYIGPNLGQGIWVYNNGRVIGHDVTKRSNIQYSQGDGEIHIGFLQTLLPIYASVEVDQLFFFNRSLTDSEITKLSQNIY